MIGFKKRPRSKCSTLVQVASLFPLTLMSAAFAQDKADDGKDGLERIEVTGVYKALSDAATIKRHAAQIVDAISAGDIGKLPDTNIAEALQRVTGVTIGRDDAGDGTSFQIRGFNENSLTINGKGVVTDGFDNRENNLNALSSSILKSITVSKSPTAKQIEGGSGGSVELTTYSPLDFDGREIRANAQVNDNSLHSDPGTKFGGIFSDRWTLDGAGDLGFLINVELLDKNTYAEGFNAQYRGVDNGRNGKFDPVGVGRAIGLLNAVGQAPDHASFAPRWGQIEQKEIGIETNTLSSVIQWAPSDRLSIELSGSYNEYLQNKANSRLRLDTQSLGGNRGKGQFGVTLEPGATWDTLTRDVTGREFDSSTVSGDFSVPGGSISNQYFTSAQPATGQVSRSMLTSGIFLGDSQNNNQNSLVNSNGQLFNQEKLQTNIGLNIEWDITDDFFVKAQFGQSRSETDNLNRTMNLQLETILPGSVTPETPLGTRLYPSLGYDIRNGGDLPDYEILWREPVLDADGNHIGGQAIEGFNPDYLDPAQRNDLFRLSQLNKQLSRTRAYGDEYKVDFSWNVDVAGITKVEFGGRYDSLENWKDRSDFRTPFEPGFEDNDGDGLPDDLDGDGLPDNPDRRASRPNRTLTSLINDPLVGKEDAAYSSVTSELVDEFLVLREGMTGVDGNIPRQFWGTTNSPAKWDEFINSVYGGHSVILNDLQTEKTFEDTTALYLMANFEYEVAGMPLTGNLGVRHGETKGQSEAFIAHCNMPWAVDVEKTAIVRAERDVFDVVEQAWIDGGKVGDQPKFTPSYWDPALSAHQNRNGRADNKSFCNTRDEPGGDQVALIFKSDPWSINENVPAVAELTTGTAATDGGSRHKDYLASEYDYTFTLPSLNLSLGITDEMFLRMALYKTMARPGGNDLSLDPSCGGAICTQGNPDLKPFRTNSFDLSWEWYMSETDSLSVAYFYKELIDQKIIYTDFNVDLNKLVRRPVNGGDGSLDGLELSAVHTFTYLPVPGFGISANLSFVKSDQSTEWDEFTGLDLPVGGRAESTYNFAFFYEHNGWNARIAYNWRDKKLSGQDQGYNDLNIAVIDVDRSGFAGETIYANRLSVNPRNWNEAYAQLEFQVGYKFSEKLGVNFNVKNMTKSSSRTYTAIKEATRGYNLAASFYNLGVNWKF